MVRQAHHLEPIRKANLKFECPNAQNGENKGTKPDAINPAAKLVIPAAAERRAGIQEASVNKQPAVYILASKRNGTLYIGVTSDLVKRIWEHRENMVEGFTKRYNVHILVWYELHESMESAITREKRLKNWKRNWKLELIENSNPKWLDLYLTIV
jgi:putative endonuclease